MGIQNEKIAVVYFSHKGMNYSNGNIIELTKGNTEIAAEMIAEYVSGDIKELVREEAYPFDYSVCVEVAKEELKANARPKLKDKVDISTYNIIFLGYPNWCGTMPMPVWTFLEEQDFEGKVIMPFCTNEGSGMGHSVADLKNLVKGADVRNGLPLHGSSVSEASESIKQWIQGSLK